MTLQADIDPAHAGQPAGSAHGGANGSGVKPDAAQPGGGTGEPDDIAQRIKAAAQAGEQRGFDTGFGKGRGQLEKAVARAAEEAVANARQNMLAELGFESPEAVEVFRAERAQAEAKRPEAERKIRAAEAAVKAAERRAKEATDALAVAATERAQIGERYFGMYRRNLASEIVAKGGLHATAKADLNLYLDALVKTEDGGRLVLSDGDLAVELDPEGGATDLDKIVAHLGKTRAHWFQPSGTPSSAAPMRRPSAPGQAPKPKTSAELRHDMIQATVEQATASMMQRR